MDDAVELVFRRRVVSAFRRGAVLAFRLRAFGPLARASGRSWVPPSFLLRRRESGTAPFGDASPGPHAPCPDPGPLTARWMRVGCASLRRVEHRFLKIIFSRAVRYLVLGNLEY